MSEAWFVLTIDCVILPRFLCPHHRQGTLLVIFSIEHRKIPARVYAQDMTSHVIYSFDPKGPAGLLPTGSFPALPSRSRDPSEMESMARGPLLKVSKTPIETSDRT
jgi:hypothetical protein